MNHSLLVQRVARSRVLLPTLAAASLACPLLRAAPDLPPEQLIGGFVVGCQAWTFNRFSVLEAIEKLVREFNIKVGIHNHPRQPANPACVVWDPEQVRKLLAGRDARIGATADTGHWARSGLDPVKCLKILDGRVVSLHLKDVSEKNQIEARDVVFGTGVNNMKGILDELRRQRFTGNISIEYESNWDNSLPDVAQCVGFLRGYGAAVK